MSLPVGEPRILQVYPMISRYDGHQFADQVRCFEATASAAEVERAWELLGMIDRPGTLTDHLGGVEVRREGDLLLFTYSNELAFSRGYLPGAIYPVGWNAVSLPCRGLVARRLPDGALRLVARPMPKFFNKGEVLATSDAALAELERSGAIVNIARKMDGSLGILFWDEAAGRWRLITRGSFASEQGEIGERLLYGLPHWRKALSRLHRHLTYAVEIIYPENRIVVDYGDTSDLFLLRVVHLASGYLFTDSQMARHAAELGVPTTHIYAGGIERVIAERSHLPGSEDEGVVLLYSTGELPYERLMDPAYTPDAVPEQRLVKIKWGSYLEIHKSVTVLMNPAAAQNAVLDAIRATIGIAKPGVLPWDDFQAAFPPDRLPEIQRLAEVVWRWREERLREAVAWRDHVLAKGPFDSRGAMAAVISRDVPHLYRGAVFALMDGKPYEPLRGSVTRQDVFGDETGPGLAAS